MRLVLWLAFRDLSRSRLLLLCNAAMLAGMLVPMLVLFGVKTGIYRTLEHRLLSDPRLLQIDTLGEGDLSEADLTDVQGWPGVRFATLKTRSLFDYVSVRAVQGGPRQDAVIFATAAGDPVLPPGLVPGPQDAVVTDTLAAGLGARAGDGIVVVTQSENRSPQLVQKRRIAAIIPARDGMGSLVLLDLASVDRIEAFYDGYALPDHGVPDGRPLGTRHASFEGMRVQARSIDDLVALDRRLSARLGMRTQSMAAEAARLIGFGRSLDLALGLAAAVAAIGLATALLFGFWSEVQRKRRILATLALMGLRPVQIAFYPLAQAAMTVLAGMALALALTVLAARVADRLFAASIDAGGSLVVLPAVGLGLIFAAVLVAALAAAGAASLAALRIDPAIVLRDEV